MKGGEAIGVGIEIELNIGCYGIREWVFGEEGVDLGLLVDTFGPWLGGSVSEWSVTWCLWSLL